LTGTYQFDRVNACADFTALLAQFRYDSFDSYSSCLQKIGGAFCCSYLEPQIDEPSGGFEALFFISICQREKNCAPERQGFSGRNLTFRKC
tara:strand:+ start:274 stop:546 length:273 start_codon:yes stop_codon:yes gene_type:complete